jgi:hypothetical protein
LIFVPLAKRHLYIDSNHKRRVASVGNETSGRHVSSRVAAALAWRGALSSSPSLILRIYNEQPLYYLWTVAMWYHLIIPTLLITTFIFNPYFLIINTGTLFRIISMQTNNIIILRNDQFLTLKKNKLVKVNLIIKLKEKLNLTTLLFFNGYILSLNKDSIALRQKS